MIHWDVKVRSWDVVLPETNAHEPYLSSRSRTTHQNLILNRGHDNSV